MHVHLHISPLFEPSSGSAGQSPQPPAWGTVKAWAVATIINSYYY